MKLFSKNIDNNGKGTATLQIEDEQDIWSAYNLINRGDSVKSSTYRKGKIRCLVQFIFILKILIYY